MNPEPSVNGPLFACGIALIALWLSTTGVVATEESNNAPSTPPASQFRMPNLDDVTVKGIRISPESSPCSDSSGQGSVSFDAPGTTLPMSVPLPVGRISSNKSEFVVAPIPFLSPSIGFGSGLGAGYIYNPASAGTNAPPWVTGGGGFYSDNGSWGAGAAHKMNWNEDRWRLFAAAGYADLKYDFFGIGSGAGEAGQSVPLRQTGAGGVIELLRGVGNHWYVGGRYLLGNVQTSVETSGPNVPPALVGLPLRLDTRLSAFGLRLQRDTRNSTFYPTHGALFDVEVNFFEDALGSDSTFQTYVVAYNRYFELATNQVLAVRGYGRGTGGDAPFFSLSSFGSGADLRGYTPGRYRDKLMFAVQAEYRWRFTERFGLVAFGGVGSVAPEIGQFDKLLPSAGTGLRYLLAKENNVSLRFDAAWGRDEHTFYVGIGEAF
jgi:Omp85 superfamily domain